MTTKKRNNVDGELVPRNLLAKEMKENPRYRHITHKTKQARLAKQLKKEANKEVKEFLEGEENK